MVLISKEKKRWFYFENRKADINAYFPIVFIVLGNTLWLLLNYFNGYHFETDAFSIDMAQCNGEGKLRWSFLPTFWNIRKENIASYHVPWFTYQTVPCSSHCHVLSGKGFILHQKPFTGPSWRSRPDTRANCTIHMTERFRKHGDISGIPDSKVLGDNMGPIWVRQDPSGPHVGPMNFPIWDILLSFDFPQRFYRSIYFPYLFVHVQNYFKWYLFIGKYRISQSCWSIF